MLALPPLKYPILQVAHFNSKPYRPTGVHYNLHNRSCVQDHRYDPYKLPEGQVELFRYRYCGSKFGRDGSLRH